MDFEPCDRLVVKSASGIHYPRYNQDAFSLSENDTSCAFARCPQVKGFSSAKFKSFPTQNEAEDFAHGKSDTIAPRESKLPAEQTKKRGIQQVNNTRDPQAKTKAPPAAKHGAAHVQCSDFRLEMYFDGGSRGNPGISGAGCVLRIIDGRDSRLAISMRKYVGDRATNNQAEYEGLLLGLKKALSILLKRCVVVIIGSKLLSVTYSYIPSIPIPLFLFCKFHR